MRYKLFTLLTLLFNYLNSSFAQNSLTGDGFGGRSWYVAHNYRVGSYSGFTVCGANNQLYGWGGNVWGELGNNTLTSVVTPIEVQGMSGVKFCSSGYISGAIKNDNTAWAWGGQGFGTGLPGSPTFMLANVKFLDAGVDHIVFVKNDGTVWAFGNNLVGQLGNGTTSSEPTINAVQMIGISNAVRAIAVGMINNPPAASVILLADGTVKITGGYQWFSLTNDSTPVTVPGLSNIVDIKGNTLAVYALNAAGDVYSFGRDKYPGNGVLGLGLPPSVYSYTAPTKVIFPSGAAPIIALSSTCDGLSTFALDENGNVYGWGDNKAGQLGDGTVTNRTIPELIASNVIDIFAGESFSYLLKSDNTLWCTGKSGWGDTYGSIWMNLPNVQRNLFTQINPLIEPMNLCTVKPFGVVPVKLLHFECFANENIVNLIWASAEEINLKKYVIQSAPDGRNFNEIGSIAAKGSNSNYSCFYERAQLPMFYRLKMINIDGSFQYSEIRTLTTRNQDIFTIAPNPSGDNIFIYGKSNLSIKSIQILNSYGRVIEMINNFNADQSINIHALASGIYFLKVVDMQDKFKIIKFQKT